MENYCHEDNKGGVREDAPRGVIPYIGYKKYIVMCSPKG